MGLHSRIRTASMREYDANESTLMINGKLIYGFSENSMFTVTDDQDSSTLKIDPQGTATKSRNNKTSGTLTVPLDETSPCNAVMLDLFNQDATFPVDLITSTDHISASYAFITKRAELQGQASSGDRSWNIKMLNYDDVSNMTYQA
ncbi:hypothetical protein EFS28_09870 [Lactobacillus acidophilus]|uniref:hypothetical protein n=1 Tax=Lactobacillus acidophilus TaxID=1579 RepID=UPI0021A3138C|nr:hypothetical protein [Lactobacillus acidophilus]MCT3602259.1 hypothetical protein [Lactobacillus acidophilus]MCT3624498.1 hypothetical protein [Lactobacillus acidophilus]